MKHPKKVLNIKVAARETSATAVLEASRRWASSTARALGAWLRPELAPGEELPDLELLQELFGRTLARRWRRVAALDEARGDAEARHARLLQKLECAVRALYREVVDLRRLLRGVFGAGSASRLQGFRGATSRDPAALLRQARRLLRRLRDRSRALPAASFEPTASDRSRWTAPTARAAGRLRRLRSRASAAGKKVEIVRAEHRRAVAEYDDVFVRVAGWLEYDYRAAGLDRRAEAVRPCRRRKGLRLEETRRRRSTGGEVAPPAIPGLQVAREAAAEMPAASEGPADQASGWSPDRLPERSTGQMPVAKAVPAGTDTPANSPPSSIPAGSMMNTR